MTKRLCGVQPFWKYYGGKFRAAPRYPAPLYPATGKLLAGAAYQTDIPRSNP